jgi:predicted ATPase
MRSTQLRTGSEFVEFSESKSGRGIESWETSDGSLRALAILVAVETAQNGDTIVVEEPEQNLHPWAIRALIDHIRDVISLNSIQVIITTHSEHVLERATPEEVLVASRTLEEGTTYRRVTELVKKGSVSMGEVGRLWVKGLLGGVPTVQ